MDISEIISKGELAPHLRSGKEAENRAVLFLEDQGMQILTRNFRVRGGEIDIVALDSEVLIFVEVRWRKNNAFGGAIASLNPRKLKRMQLAVACYLQRYACDLPCRLDVLCQVGSGHAKWLWVRGFL